MKRVIWIMLTIVSLSVPVEISAQGIVVCPKKETQSESSSKNRKKIEPKAEETPRTPEQMFKRGEREFSKGNNKDAMRWYREGAEQGYAPAQCSLGYMYGYTSEGKYDYAEALKWFQQAADHNDGRACVFMGHFYNEGKGVRVNKAEAVKWYRKGAELGYAVAQTCLGNMYKEGEGVEQDLEEAKRWYKKAAAQGDNSAKRALERMR